ncbi:MAG: hypothetical protein ACYTGP_12905, partial [Planctomycetota bacterium]|jgi:hypothetical protein
MAGLGGKYFLDTFSLSTGSTSNMHLVDAVLGLVVVAGVLLGALRRRGMVPVAAAGILLLLAVLPPPMVNMGALMLGTALLLSLFRILDSDRLARERPWLGMCLIAIVTAALVPLKSTFLVPTGLVLTFSYLVHIATSPSKGRAFLEGVGCALLIGLLLLPWMISLHRSSGTFLFPLLGKGVDGSQYGIEMGTHEYRTTARTLLLLWIAISQPLFVATAAAGAVVLPARGRSWFAGRGATVALVGGCCVAAVLIVLVTTATGLSLRWGANRYCFPILFAALLALLVVAKGPRWRAVVLVVVGAGLVAAYPADLKRLAKQIDFGVRAGLEDLPPLTSESIRAGQDAVPEGAPILARLDRPFLLDFTRNPIYVIDHPLLVSPAPGMPRFEGGEAVDRYLADLGIRHLMFTHVNEANYAESRYSHRLGDDHHPVWRTIARHAFDFNDSVRDLARARRWIYVDDETLVLSLDEPRDVGPN